MDEDEFGSVHIDSYDKRWGKEDHAPNFDYWIYKYRRQRLNDEQKAFLAKMRATLMDGTALKCPGFYAYLNLLRDELIQYSNKPIGKDRRIQMAMNLMSVYGYQDSKLKEMILSVRNQKSAARIRLSSKDPAKWIMPGDKMESTLGSFVRGAFYWGNFLNVHSYNSQTRTFAKAVTRIEGPILSEKAFSNNEYVSGLPFSTLIEMPETSKTALLKFLQGEEIADKSAIAYYLSGIETRLLADADITIEERKELLQYLYSLRNSPSVKCLNIDYAMRYDYTLRIDNLVDFTLARFFSSNPETVFPMEILRQMPVLNRTHVALHLSQLDCSEGITDEMAKAVAENIWPPIDLPVIYEEDFRRAFEHEFKNFDPRRTYLEDSKEPEYYPIKEEVGYGPIPELENILKKPAIRFSQECNRKMDIAKAAFRTLKYDLTYFLAMKQRGSGLLTQKYYLPSWCDPNKLPGFTQLQEAMTLGEDEPFRMTSVKELLRTLDIRIPDYFVEYVDETTLDQLRLNLTMLNLNLGAATTGTMKLRYDDTVGIFPVDIPQVPNRGTALVALFLIGWIVQIDGCKPNDFAVIDEWISEYWGKQKWEISAKAIIRWLVQRKITMTQKRKKKIAQLANFANKRDELMPLLLRLASGENLSPKRMKRLEAVYSLIGLDPANIHSDLHRMATTASVNKTKKSLTAGSKASSIDKNLLREMEASTKKAQKILAQVFNESEKKEENAADIQSSKKEPLEFKILRKLTEKETWSRSEIEQLCSAEGKTPADVLETLNDMSFDKLDEPVAEEDDDTITIDISIASQLLE